MGAFNQPVVDVVWPRHLRALDLEGSFNQPIIDAEWPPVLEVLKFGNRFTQEVEGVAWLISLKNLELDSVCYDTLGYVEWPTTLLVVQGDYYGRRARHAR